MATVIKDTFADAVSTTQSGTAPDTTNTPGDTWDKGSGGECTTDGAGVADFGSTNIDFRIDSGEQDQDLTIIVDWDASDNAAADAFYACVRREDLPAGNASSDYYAAAVLLGAANWFRLYRFNGGAIDSTIYTGAPFTAPSAGTSVTVRIVVQDNGSGNPELQCWVNGTPIDFGSGTTHEDTDANKIVGAVGQTFVGFRASNMTFSGVDDFQVDTIAAGSTATPLHYYRMMQS